MYDVTIWKASRTGVNVRAAEQQTTVEVTSLVSDTT